jgi:hypothetical protein
LVATKHVKAQKQFFVSYGLGYWGTLLFLVRLSDVTVLLTKLHHLLEWEPPSDYSDAGEGAQSELDEQEENSENIVEEFESEEAALASVIVSYRIVSYRIVSYRIVSYRIISFHIVSYRIVS